MFCALLFAGVGKANTVIIAPNGGGIQQEFDISTFITTADRMAGRLTVHINFSNGTTSDAIWAVCGGTCGFASANPGSGSWTLTATGDTGAISTLPPDTHGLTAWTLTNSTGLTISSIVLDGTTAINGTAIIFDRDRSEERRVGKECRSR